ncbi:MAG: hypothetical protein HZA04_08650 [Nitrospinae bacterium]|nr:hypothetical protein [Nitrospinota bacterium]
MKRNGIAALFIATFVAIASLLPSCAKKDEFWSERDREMSAHYYNSQRDNREATRLINRAGLRFSAQEHDAVKALTARALHEATLIDDEFLDKVHPEFKLHYRNEFQLGLELALRNLDNPDYQSAKKSTELFSNFVDWYNEHRTDIRLPQ